MLVRVMKFGLPALFAVLLLAMAPAKAATIVVPGFLDQPVVVNNSYVGTTSATGSARRFRPALAGGDCGPMDTVTTLTEAFPPNPHLYLDFLEWLDRLQIQSAVD